MRRNPPRSPDAPPALPPNLSFVFDIPPSVMTLGLANMRSLLDAIDHPERAFRSVVVAGTNGKGTVTAYLAAILSANGIRTGQYSSPHVFSIAERIRLDNEAISIDEMERAAARIVPHYEAIGFSYFEAITAIAFLVFAERTVEVAVLETGLGGRFDATNVVEPEVTVLTGISLDHRRILGDTEEEILREKLGITRRGVPFLAGPLSDELEAVLRERTARAGVPTRLMTDIGEATIEHMGWDGMEIEIRTARRDYGTVPFPFIGLHHASNALLAVAAAEYLVSNVTCFAEAAAAASLPGRFEVHSIKNKTVVFDVAHNDAALIAVTRTLAAISPPSDNALVLGMLKRKELQDFPALAPRWIRRLYLVEPIEGECFTGPELAELVAVRNLQNQGMDVIIDRPLTGERAWSRWLDAALGASSPCRVVLIAGSFRTVEAFGREMTSRGYL